MHNYNTVRAIHDDRMRELTRKADAHRLAANAREGRARRDPSQRVRRWLSSGSVRQWFDARRSPALRDGDAIRGPVRADASAGSQR